MTSPSPFNDGGQYAWDSTSLTLVQDCLWKYRAVMLEGWRKVDKSPHLSFGGWYASALEHFHKHLALGDDRETALRKIVREALESTWTEDGPWQSTHNTKTRENLIRSIIWYAEFFNPDPLETVILSDGRPAVEYSFALEIDDGLVYSGHIDRLVRYGDDVYVQDQKTTGGTIGSYYFDGFDPDIQMSGYTFAAKTIWPGPIKGVIIDAAQIAVGFTRFERGFTFRTNAKLEEWYADTLYWIATARTAYQHDYWPRNRTSCGKYGGCQFRQVCQRSPEVRPQFLKADFVQGKQWNPLEKR